MITTEEKQQLRNQIERHRKKNPDYDQIISSMFPKGVEAIVEILDLDPSTPEQIRQIPKSRITVEQTAKIRAFYRIRYAIFLLESGEKARQQDERETNRIQTDEANQDENEPDWEHLDQLDEAELARAEEIAKARLEHEPSQSS